MAVSACLSDGTKPTNRSKSNVTAGGMKSTDGDVENVTDQISEMLKNVPLLGETFSISNKIGSGRTSKNINEVVNK